jgi:secreted Zn-dependent insulinase-like peptidase
MTFLEALQERQSLYVEAQKIADALKPPNYSCTKEGLELTFKPEDNLLQLEIFGHHIEIPPELIEPLIDMLEDFAITTPPEDDLKNFLEHAEKSANVGQAVSP